MSAGDAMGSCPRRGEAGHLPHPDGRACITNNTEANRGPAPGVYSEDQLAGQRREVPGTSVQVEELHDRIAVLEQRNGALDANAEAAKQRLARLHRDHDRLLDQLTALEQRLLAERRAHQETAGTCDDLARKLAEARTPDQALATLGLTRGQVEVGQAVELLGQVYVRRDLLVAGIQDASRLIDAQASGPFAGGDLADHLPRLNVEGTALMSEAAGGVFVPIPEGHMLSVTVTPYDNTPEVAHDSTCQHD